MTLDLDELERLGRESTPGPWTAQAEGTQEYYADFVKIGRSDPQPYDKNNLEAVCLVFAEDESAPDARYIVALREAAPQLIAIARAAREIDHMRGTYHEIPIAAWNRLHFALNPNPLPTPAEERSNG